VLAGKLDLGATGVVSPEAARGDRRSTTKILPRTAHCFHGAALMKDATVRRIAMQERWRPAGMVQAIGYSTAGAHEAGKKLTYRREDTAFYRCRLTAVGMHKDASGNVIADNMGGSVIGLDGRLVIVGIDGRCQAMLRIKSGLSVACGAACTVLLCRCTAFFDRFSIARAVPKDNARHRACEGN